MLRTIFIRRPKIEDENQLYDRTKLTELSVVPPEIPINEEQGYTVVIPFSKKDNQYYILTSQRINTKIYTNQYQTCGGHKEDFEKFKECAIREAKEEINLMMVQEKIQLILKHTYYSHNKSGTKPTTNKDYQDDRINQVNLVQIPTYLYMVQQNEINQIRNNEPNKQINLEWRTFEQCKHLVFTPTLQDNIEKIFKEYIPKYDNEYSKRGKVTNDPYQINQKRKNPKNQ